MSEHPWPGALSFEACLERQEAAMEAAGAKSAAEWLGSIDDRRPQLTSSLTTQEVVRIIREHRDAR